MLPAGIPQHQEVGRRAASAARKAPRSLIPDAPAGHAEGSGAMRQVLGGAGAAALLLWKFKFIAVFLLSKAKFLLLGLSKGGTLVSMLLSFGVYWAAWGWTFAAGLVGSIYVHEMGHVAALHRLGVKASGPMFIPGFGAMIRLKEAPGDPAEDAEVGLAGPIWGLGAALFCWVAYLATGGGAWAAIAKLGAWINLFNLLPFWQLDGARGFRALNKQQRWMATAFLGAALLLSGEGLLILLGVGAAWQAWQGGADQPNWKVLAAYVLLASALTWLAIQTAPLPT